MPANRGRPRFLAVLDWLTGVGTNVGDAATGSVRVNVVASSGGPVTIGTVDQGDPNSGGADAWHVQGPLTDAELRASPVPVDDGHPNPQTDGLTDTELRATPVPIRISGSAGNADVKTRADGVLALEVADDMSSFQSFTQSLVASADTIITFAQAVRLIKVKNNSTTDVVYVKNGAISSDTPTDAELLGVAPTANVPSTDWYPYLGTTIHLRSAGVPQVSVTGFF